MRGPFDDDDDYERRQSSNDTEVTLGAGTLLLLVGGLIVVCSVCFGIGYWVGHRGVASPAEAQQAAQQSVDAPPATQSSNSPIKPAATTQPPRSAPAQAAPVSSLTAQPSSDAPQPSAATPVPALPSPQNPAQDTSQPQVRPALPAATTSPQYPSRPADTAAQSQVRPAQTPAATLWVQVAAVSHVEDAQVLTNALKKKGYTVTPRREADNLIHVRIGPFPSRDEANSWRAKLLSDGYNAEIQQ